MVEPVQLSREEIVLLTQHFRKAQNTLIRERAQAILAFHEGISVYQLGIVIRRSEKTVREWINTFQKGRISSIFPRYKGDNASKLTKEQKQQLKDVLSKPPSEYGIPKEFWDISTLKTYIKAEFGIEYESDESYRLIFVLHNYSFHLPDTFDIHRDEKKIVARVKEIKKEIKPMLKSKDCVVFTSDECRIVWESEIRRLWLPKGQKTIINVERKRQAQSFIGFLNLKTGEELLYKISWQNQSTIIPILERLTKKYPDKNICIIWDNARFHHGKMLKAKLSITLRRVHLINLPPYAPDHNPQEHVWKYGKEMISNNQRESLEETVSAFETAIISRKYHYQF